MLGKKGVVLHGQLGARSCLVEDASEVKQLGREGDGRDSEDAKKAEFDWQDLVGASDLDRNAHGELFIFVLRRLLVLLD